MSDKATFIVVGGGLAGALAVNRLGRSNPQSTFILLEKESMLGGRIKSGATAETSGLGLGAISSRLYEYWNQSLKSDPEGLDLPSYQADRQAETGILIGNKVSCFSTDQISKPSGAKVLGGFAASKQWPDLLNALAPKDSESKRSLAEQWTAPRKSPAPIVLETFAGALGVTDIWDTTTDMISQRLESISDRPFFGDWNRAIDALLDPLIEANRCKVVYHAQVIHADFEEVNGWTVDTSVGEFHGDQVIVCHAPWTAAQWLPKQYWPSSFATIVSKTKPVSLVTLRAPIEAKADTTATPIPQIIFVPSEGCHCVIHSQEVVIQTCIDYEMSVVAPDVVKSVKRLKRALKKFRLAYPDLKLGTDKVALVPVGWAQPLSISERKIIEKVKFAQMQSQRLMFCGDGYGSSSDGDSNLIESIQNVLEVVGS